MKLFHPTVAQVAWRGQTFEPDASGAFDVPPEAARELAEHGFTREAAAAPPRLVPAEQHDAVIAERDALAARVAELEAKLAAAPKGKAR